MMISPVCLEGGWAGTIKILSVRNVGGSALSVLGVCSVGNHYDNTHTALLLYCESYYDYYSYYDNVQILK